MFARDKDQKGENTLVELERKISELDIQNEVLNREIDSLLAEHNVSSSQISAFVSNSSHFSPLNWETLQKERKRLEDKLKRDLDNLISKKEHQKTRESLKTIQPNWLFIR